MSDVSGGVGMHVEQRQAYGLSHAGGGAGGGGGGVDLDPNARPSINQVPRRPYKIVVIGDAGVGKTCLLNRCIRGNYQQEAPTISPSISSTEFRVPNPYITNNDNDDNEDDGDNNKLSGGEYNNPYSIHAQFWDTAGQERFGSSNMPQFVFRGMHGVIVVFDLSDPTSYSDCTRWIQQISEHVMDDEPGCAPAIMLIGAKSDQEHRVSSAEARAFVHKNNWFGYHECSAKTGEGVSEAFEHIAIECERKFGIAYSDWGVYNGQVYASIERIQQVGGERAALLLGGDDHLAINNNQIKASSSCCFARRPHR